MSQAVHQAVQPVPLITHNPIHYQVEAVSAILVYTLAKNNHLYVYSVITPESSEMVQMKETEWLDIKTQDQYTEYEHD